MEPVGEGIREELRRLGADSSAGADQNDAWLAAVGPEIARNAWPARTQADGTLVVHVRDAIWGFELSQQAPEIAARSAELSPIVLPAYRNDRRGRRDRRMET